MYIHTHFCKYNCLSPTCAFFAPFTVKKLNYINYIHSSVYKFNVYYAENLKKQVCIVSRYDVSISNIMQASPDK